MKGVRFYLEFPSPGVKRHSGRANAGHSGNVLALFERRLEGLGAVLFEPNSPVACVSCCWEYLKQCKRISERTAREIHPNLFQRLDSSD